MVKFLLLVAVMFSMPAPGAERFFNFNDYPLNQPPAGFRSTVAGTGKPGDWKVILEDTTPHTESSETSPAGRRAVLAQLAREPLDNHFPILLFDQESYGDFKLTTRFKLVGGALEQMAGIVFRFQNESNFYVVRASGLGKNLRCYKVEDGILKLPIGPELEVSKGVWHELTVECEGTRIRCGLDGNDAIKIVDGSSKAAGKIGFWTKSDSISYFVDTKITYTPREILAHALVRNALKDYPRVLGLRIFAIQAEGGQPSIVASKDEKELAQKAGKTEQYDIRQGTSYFGRDKGTVSVTLPLRDRNGDPIAAVRIVLKSFPGQTEDNAVSRALPIVKDMQARVQTLDELLQ